METLFSISIGVGLAAACGFRVFIPLLVMSIASQTGNLELAAGFEWIGSFPAMIAFAAATLIEIVGYYIPWVDNLLDSIATPAAVIAGVIVTAAAATELSPLLQWSLAIIAGGGAAATVQVATGATRLASTASTGGLANPLVSTTELFGATGLALIAIAIPIVALVVVLLLVIFGIRKIMSRKLDQGI
jgi:hypothetical protein